MEVRDILENEVGTQEPKRLEAKPVKIVAVTLKKKTNDGKDMKTPIVVVQCKHPDKDELLDITKIKFLKNDKVIVSGLWAQLDDDKKIQKSSAVDILLKKLGCSKLSDTYSMEIETILESEDGSFLCLKAY